MSLSDALLLEPYPFEIFIAYRNDDQKGTGTLNDPLNGATKFDEEQVSVLTICIDSFHWVATLRGMPRQLRMQYAGAIYHVMNRGDQREDIFRDDQDRRRFLSTLGEACAKTEWQVHAYCLMSIIFIWSSKRPNQTSSRG